MRRIDQAYEFIKGYINEKGYPPTIREIGDAIGVSSTSTVAYYLRKLEEDNRIVKGCYKNRSIQLMETIQNKLDASNLVTMPVIGELSMGAPLLDKVNIVETFAFTGSLFKGYDMFIMQVKDDSMTSSGILYKDYVVVSRQNVARNGEIVVAMLDKKPTVTRIYKEFNLFKLQPYSKHTPQYAEKVLILGKVVGVIRTEVK